MLSLFLGTCFGYSVSKMNLLKILWKSVYLRLKCHFQSSHNISAIRLSFSKTNSLEGSSKNAITCARLTKHGLYYLIRSKN